MLITLFCIFSIISCSLTSAMEQAEQEWYWLYISLKDTQAEQQITQEVTEQYKNAIYYQKPQIAGPGGLMPAGKMRISLYDTPENITKKFQGRSWFKPELIKNMQYFGFCVPCDNADTEKELKEQVMQEYKEVHYYDRPQFLSPSKTDHRLYIELRDTAEDIIQKFGSKPWFKPEMLKKTEKIQKRN